MMNAEIIRVESSVEGTFGVLLLDGHAFCCTIEEKWLENKVDSCIPEGLYTAFRRVSPSRGYEVWEFHQVPKRTYIQIHPGNTIDDTLGCVLVGASFGKLKGNRAVLNSGTTFELLMDATRYEQELVVTVRSAIPIMRRRD
ncbi:DUF5675 family protein [Candidatus Latescibacterota bacterium]